MESDIQSPSQPQTLVYLGNKGLHLKSSIINFTQISFAYPSRPQELVLRDIDFKIRPGQTVALVGPSGAGKSTLFELLQRFYDPTTGKISIYGLNIRKMSLAELRSLMGLVPQDPTLFSTNIWRNIRYGNPNTTDDQVIEAASRAHIHQFIQSLPDKYDSYLGERGVRLSGGQKQRIAIARAILKDPEILLLDEATSALDSESEYKIQAALTELMQKRTTIIIAHRLSTVMRADMILVIDHDQIIAKGIHSTLIKECTLYQRLCKLQFDPVLDSQKFHNETETI